MSLEPISDSGAVPQRLASPTTLRGNNVPCVHRLYLLGGRVLQGDIYRSPNVRLADHLAGLKGFVSLTDAQCQATGSVYAHVVVNMENVLFIEEVATPVGTEQA
jgi:hypothetical protein